jgi:hypothetical protein
MVAQEENHLDYSLGRLKNLTYIGSTISDKEVIVTWFDFKKSHAKEEKLERLFSPHPYTK